MDTYALNPQILPGKIPTKDQHSRMVALVLVLCLVALIAIAAYWWFSMHEQSTPVPAAPIVSAQELQKQRTIAFLRSAPVHVSEDEINSVVKLLKKNQASVSDAERQSVVSQLKNN